MIGEMEGGVPISICTLPPAVDDARDVYAPLCAVLITPIFVVGLVRSLRTRRLDVQAVLGAALIIIWGYRFFLRTAGC